MFSLYRTSELPSLFILWYRLMKLVGHYAIYATYYSSCCTELSILTVTLTIWHCSPFKECNLIATLILRLRSVGSTITFSSEVESLTSYWNAVLLLLAYWSNGLIILLMTPYCEWGGPTKTGVSTSSEWEADVSFILFYFKEVNFIIFYVVVVLAKIWSSLIFLTSFSSLRAGSKNLKSISS